MIRVTYTCCRKILMLCLLLWSLVASAAADSGQIRHILVITSYNPDTQKMYDNLADFTSECQHDADGLVDVAIETMNCKNLSEALLWTDRMADILKKYEPEGRRPSLIVLLGQEAWAAYLSQKSAFARATPVMAGMVSTNTILLPDNDTEDLQSWMPDSHDYTEMKSFNIVGGVFYHYDVNRNLRLIHQLYPKARALGFLSDNTFGGLSLQALVRRQTAHSRLKVELLDGRVKTLADVKRRIASMTPDEPLMVGTWRIDSSENYVLVNTTDELCAVNRTLPAFSITSVGLGNWTIGGYVPQYGLQGHDLADIALDYLGLENSGKEHFVIRPCKYVFDAARIQSFGIDKSKLPKDVELLNGTPDFYEQYHTLILGTVGGILLLSAGLLFALYYIIRIRRLKDALERQSVELRVARDHAEEANKMKTSFIANMSHEIRTPLNAIVGFSDLLAQGDYEESDRKQFSHIIQENSDLLLSLINDILDLSRIESGKITMLNEKCDVVDLCHTSLASVETARPLDNVEYQESIPVDKLVIMTDPMRLKQVLINLLTNASKFTKQGHILVSLRIDREANEIVFSVSDTGIGIPPEKAESVFERFVKLNAYAQGTGLGLSICRLIIEKLGGKIWVDTTYTGGARMVFTHPLTVVDAQTDTAQDKEKK